jgi:WD40 repeat protein
VLPNGRVLITGGGSDSAKSELYDPVTGKWRITGSLIAARNGHTATLLPDGRVLIVGGSDGGDSRTGISRAVSSAELYDPATETWSNVEAPASPPVFHSSLLLPGGKVLTISLRSHAGYVLNRDCAKLAQLYDPTSGTWSSGTSSATIQCAFGHGDQTRAVLLANGLVLVTGFGTAELYNPATGEWKVTADPRRVGSGHTLTLLADGQVLATGGHHEDISVSDAELYDPDTQTWTATTPLTRNRAAHSASLLANGKVLVVGGFDGSCCDSRYTLDTSDLFDVGLRQP